MEEEVKPNIILDNGSGYIKAGFTGDEAPKTVFPTCVGYPLLYDGSNKGEDVKEFFIGADAETQKEKVKYVYPIEQGVVNNWDEMEKIWGHVFFNELKVDSSEHNVMLTEAAMRPKQNKEKMAQIMFETFNVPGLYIALPALLNIYGAGKFTGFSVELGDGVSQFVQIFDGYPKENTIISIDLGGRDLTEFMVKILYETGIFFSSSYQKEIVKKIKERSCYVALDFEEELKSYCPFDYELPDGTHVVVKDQQIRCPEVLFKPNMIGKEGNGIGQTCCDSIEKCKSDVRKDLYNCVVLSGGNSMYNGLPERLNKEIKAFAPESMKEEVKVIASPERKFNAWIGGNILSSISTFKNQWITKTEYEESGETIVHRQKI